MRVGVLEKLIQCPPLTHSEKSYEWSICTELERWNRGMIVGIIGAVTRLRRHRLELRELIEAYLRSTSEVKPSSLIRIRGHQQRFANFRKSPADWNDTLAWVDSWSPPRE